MSQHPIAVFDSGIGGLTVLRSLAYRFPNEKFLYLGDTARLPYGNKSPEAIRKYTLQALNFFAPMNCKAIVIACNSASSQFPETEWNGIPVYTVIQPGAITALKQASSRIGVLGTRATIQSGMYEKIIRKLAGEQNKKIEIFSSPAPLFVPLAEEGWLDDPITNLIVYRYLQPLLQNKIDTLILGCTHYPLLRNAIQKVCTNAVTIIESGEALANQIQQDMQTGRMVSVSVAAMGSSAAIADENSIELYATDSSVLLENFAHELLPKAQIRNLKIVDLV